MIYQQKNYKQISIQKLIFYTFSYINIFCGSNAFEIILMMSKNQESSKFQESRSRFKFQESISRFKNNQDQDSSKESRLKIPKSRENSIKISIKRVFQNIQQHKNFSKRKIFYQRVLLSGNRLLVIDYQQATFFSKLIYKAVIDYHNHVIDYQSFKMLDFKFQESQLLVKLFRIISNLCNRLHNTCNQLPVFLNVLIFKFKHEESHLLMSNRLYYDGNRLPMTYFEK